MLSDSTERIDRLVKLDEYKPIPALDCIPTIDPLRHDVGFWLRDDQRAWQNRILRGLSAVADRPSLGLQLGLDALHAGVQPVPGRSRLAQVAVPPD